VSDVFEIVPELAILTSDILGFQSSAEFVGAARKIHETDSRSNFRDSAGTRGRDVRQGRIRRRRDGHTPGEG
jgi:hypothetical protein